jgi:anti-sigma regulatory factor (Ser/Thr protein kinase)
VKADMTGGRRSCRHQAGLYADDAELAAIVVPFVRAGQEMAQPVLVAVCPRSERVLREALGDVAGVQFVPAADRYRTPAQTVADLRGTLEELLAQGAREVRVAGEVPHPGTGAPWAGWARYEAAAGSVFDPWPVRGLCLYDERTTPAAVLDDVRRLHPHLALPGGGHEPSPAFEDPAGFLRRRSPTDLAPGGHPVVDVRDPSVTEARALTARAAASRLPRDEAERLVLAVSELVTNAWLHGAGTRRLTLRARPGQLEAHVADDGPGPADPFAGLTPGHDDPLEPGGRGLWIAHQVCSDIAFEYGDGFGVRAVVRA